MKRIAIVLAAAALAGCASGPIATSDATPIPVERILNAELTKPKQGAGSVILKRDTGFVGAACTLRIFANGKPYAEILPGEKIQIYLDAGDHILGATGTTLCSGQITEAPVTIKPGQTQTYLLGFGAGTDVKLHPTAF
jgi:type IV pilus biogenesis protein CpaD/CtpE